MRLVWGYVMYGFECLAINKKEEIKMKVAEIRALRWMWLVCIELGMNINKKFMCNEYTRKNKRE